MPHNMCMRKIILIHAMKNYGRVAASLAIVLSTTSSYSLAKPNCYARETSQATGC